MKINTFIPLKELSLIALLLLSIMSCKQSPNNDNQKVELELKKKELELKERELALQEKEWKINNIKPKELTTEENRINSDDTEGNEDEAQVNFNLKDPKDFIKYLLYISENGNFEDWKKILSKRILSKGEDNAISIYTGWTTMVPKEFRKQNININNVEVIYESNESHKISHILNTKKPELTIEVTRENGEFRINEN